MFPTVIFFFVLLNFIGISFGVPSYEWDSTSTVRNVHTFAKFIDDLYTEYSKTDQIDSILPRTQNLNYTIKQKRTVFNFTFVKCAAEIANFRVIINDDCTTDGGRPFRNFNVVPINNVDTVPFWHSDQSLGHQIANAFEREIFAPAKEQKIAKTVANQIMQLAFSFAVRVLLYVIHEADHNRFGIGEWQLRTLLSAFKILSAQNGANIGNGIFPFQIIQIDKGDDNHLWKQKLSADEDNAEQKQHQTQFIENFNFILRLSNFELTQYEITKVLDQIMMNKQKRTNDVQTQPPPPAIYTFIMDHFRTSLHPKRGIMYIIKMDNRLDCAMVYFGEELYKRLRCSYYQFYDYLIEKKKTCGDDVHKIRLIRYDDGQLFIADNNTPKRGSNQIVMTIFHEPVWNYVRAIKIDSNINKATKQFCDDLRNAVAAALAEKNEHKINKLTKTKEFVMCGKELYSKLCSYEMVEWRQEYAEQKSLDEKISALEELQQILDERLEEYSRANLLQLNEKMIFQKGDGNEKQKFAQIFYERLRKHNGPNVRYDEQRQLLTFPAQIGERLISRLGTFVEKNFTKIVNRYNSIDFVCAMDAIASSGDNLESEKWIEMFGIKPYENDTLFQWLFTLALRLGWQMSQKELAEKYLQILHAYVAAKFDTYFIDIFDCKINVEQNLVGINLPNWNVPYLVYLEDENELKEQRAKKPFKFFCLLRKYSPTIFDVVKMAKILHEINVENGHIFIGQSDPKLFLFILKNVSANSEDLNRLNQMLRKLKIEGESSTGKIELSVTNCFCFLAQFVVQLLEKAIDEAKYLLNIEIVNVFIGQTNTICTEEQIREEKMEIFGANVMDISKETIKIDFNLRADLQQKILPDLIAELNMMLEKEDWNCINLMHLKAVEWNLLEEGLMENEQSDEWEEIKKLMDKWMKEYNKAFSDGKGLNFQKTVEELKAKLENLKEEEQKGLGK